MLDFDAPFLSIRRLSAGAAAAANPSSPSPALAPAPAPPPSRRRFLLPFYKSEVKSGPVCNPGAVPFVWEQTPGRPKNDGGRPPIWTQKVSTIPHKVDAPKQAEAGEAVDRRPQLRQPTLARGGGCNALDEDEDEDEDADDIFTDAPDTLSRAESFLMTCSFREAPASPEPQVQEYMIARFLPAAQALASGSPQHAFRKPSTPARVPPREPNDRILSENLRRSPLVIRQHKLNHVPDLAEVINADDEEDYVVDDDDDDDCRRVPSRGCGLLPKFSLKDSLCLLNPFPGMKDRARRPRSRRRAIRSPEIKNTCHTLVDGNLCEAVHRQKQRRAQRYRCSDGGGVSPFREGKGFLGVPISDGDNRSADEVNRRKTTVRFRCQNQLEVEEEEKEEETAEAGGWVHYSPTDGGVVSPLQSPMLAPKSPSESWLLQASAKSPRPQPSFLGLRFRPSGKPNNANADRKPNALERFLEGMQPAVSLKP